MLEWVNESQAIVSLALTAVLVLVTIVYATIAGLSLKESAKLRRHHQRPRIVVRPELHPRILQIINLRVENVGGTPAYNVRLALSREVPFKDRDAALSDVGIFKAGSKIFSPGETFRTFLTSTINRERFADLRDDPPLVTVTYEDERGQTYEETFSLSLAEFEHVRWVGGDPMTEIERHLKTLAKDVSRLSSGLRKLKVISYTPAEDEAEHRAIWMMAQMRKLSEEDREKVRELIQELRGGAAEGKP